MTFLSALHARVATYQANRPVVSSLEDLENRILFAASAGLSTLTVWLADDILAQEASLILKTAGYVIFLGAGLAGRSLLIVDWRLADLPQ